MSTAAFPLLIEFVAGTRVVREPEFVSKLPVLHNGPPGTSIVFADGSKVNLPTDQIVFAEDKDGVARVGFGGMSSGGLKDGQLIFYRYHDLQPEAQLSPERAQEMTLETNMVNSVVVDGRVVWPRPANWI